MNMSAPICGSTSVDSQLERISGLNSATSNQFAQPPSAQSPNEQEDYSHSEAVFAETDRDRALIAVANYLRRVGIEHPDVIRDQSHCIVDAAAACIADARSPQEGLSPSVSTQLGSLSAESLANAIDRIKIWHDQLIESECSQPASRQTYLSGISRLLVDPNRLTVTAELPDFLKNQIASSKAIVIPRPTHLPMQPAVTPELIGPLRADWWLGLAARCVSAIGALLPAPIRFGTNDSIARGE